MICLFVVDDTVRLCCYFFVSDVLSIDPLESVRFKRKERTSISYWCLTRLLYCRTLSLLDGLCRVPNKERNDSLHCRTQFLTKQEERRSSVYRRCRNGSPCVPRTVCIGSYPTEQPQRVYTSFYPVHVSSAVDGTRRTDSELPGRLLPRLWRRQGPTDRHS